MNDVTGGWSSGARAMVGGVMDDDHVDGMRRGFGSRRVLLPSSGVESWTVVGPDGRPVGLVDEFLGWLTGIERSPNTVAAYARDLGLFWAFLAQRGLVWDRVSVAELGEFAAWARRPAENVVVISEQAARRSASTVNRMLAAVMSFYELHGRRGNVWARDLVVRTRSGRGSYKPDRLGTDLRDFEQPTLGHRPDLADGGDSHALQRVQPPPAKHRACECLIVGRRPRDHHHDDCRSQQGGNPRPPRLARAIALPAWRHGNS